MRTSSSVGHCATVVVVVLLATVVGKLEAARTTNECQSGDKSALLVVKAGFGNASYFHSWKPDFPCCNWTGVSCDGSASPYTMRRVVGLSFQHDDKLTGPLPGAAIARLTALQQLVVTNVPRVNGNIPRELTRLSNLSFLEISYTGMSGPVPSFLSELSALTYLRLYFNSFTGAIPTSLADIPNLSFIDFGHNHLTGTIPPLLLSNASEAYLYLSHNHLTGTIPAEFAAVDFWVIDLSDNGFIGDASVLFGANKSLEDLVLSRNAFSFNFSTVQLPWNLNALDVSHNDIYGNIPPQLADLELTYLNVSYNRLSGEIPFSGNMAWFDAYCFQHNKGLCGYPLSPCK